MGFLNTNAVFCVSTNSAKRLLKEGGREAKEVGRRNVSGLVFKMADRSFTISTVTHEVHFGLGFLLSTYPQFNGILPHFGPDSFVFCNEFTVGFMIKIERYR